MQLPHAFHALFALHKLVSLTYIHTQQSDGISGASSSTRLLLLPKRDRSINDTPPPSRWSAKMTLTGPPPPVGVIFCPIVSRRYVTAIDGKAMPVLKASAQCVQTLKKASINKALNGLICVRCIGALPHYVFNRFATQHIFSSTNSKGPADGSNHQRGRPT